MRACQTCSFIPFVLFGHIVEADDKYRITVKDQVSVDPNQLVDHLPVDYRYQALAEKSSSRFFDGFLAVC